MSVQSEINRISSEVWVQADIISQIKTALEGKIGGSDGGDVDAILDELHEYAQSIISGGDTE